MILGMKLNIHPEITETLSLSIVNFNHLNINSTVKIEMFVQDLMIKYNKNIHI